MWRCACLPGTRGVGRETKADTAPVPGAGGWRSGAQGGPLCLYVALQQVAHGLDDLAYAFLAVMVLGSGKGGIGITGPLQAVAGSAQVPYGLFVPGEFLCRGAGQGVGAEQAAQGSLGVGIGLRWGWVKTGRMRFQSALPQHRAVSMCIINAQRKLCLHADVWWRGA